MRKDTMHDPWMDRLSEYIDGGLDAGEARALERHVAGCDTCSVTLDELRAVVAAARAAGDQPPAQDLWAGIAAAIDADAAHAGRRVAVLPLRRAGAPAPRFSFSAPQLAAAALVLMSLSAGAAWLLGGGAAEGGVYEEGAIFQSAGALPDEVRLVGTAPAAPPEPSAAYIDDALAAARAVLDPATVEVLERSIEAINAAIADSHAALEADPGNPYLQRQLDSTVQRRQEVLRRAGRVQRAGT
jgi:hypothetical protein